MPTHKPTRAAPGMALVLPRVTDAESTQRAIDQIALLIRQLQGLAGSLRADVDALSAAGDFDTFIEPPQITSVINNWDIGALGSRTLVYVTSDATRAVHGLVGGADRKVVCLLNINAVGGNTPSYQHESGLAALGNRFHNAGLAARSGGSSGAVWYIYHGASTVWRNIGDTT